MKYRQNSGGVDLYCYIPIVYLIYSLVRGRRETKTEMVGHPVYYRV